MNCKKYIKIAEIKEAHGIKGQIKLKPSKDFYNLFKAMPKFNKINFFNENFDLIKLKINFSQGEYFISEIENINSRDDAKKLKGQYILCKTEELPKLDEDEFYYSDIINKNVYESDKIIGKVININNFGAGDIVEIQKIDGDIVVYPFKKEIFIYIDDEKIIIKEPKIV